MTTYQVRLINKKRKIDVTIPVDDDVYILDAAEDNDIELPYTCRSGACSSCVGKIVEGEIDQEDQSFLEDEQIDKGFALLCTTYPRSNLTVKTHMEERLLSERLISEPLISRLISRFVSLEVRDCLCLLVLRYQALP